MTENTVDSFAADSTANFDIQEFQRQVITEFRENNGKLGGMFEGWTLCVLTTTGAKTGLRRESLLSYMTIDGRPLVVGSAMGADTNPAWYHNVKKNPEVLVETGTETYHAIATITTGVEREALFGKVVAQDPGMGEYQAKTSRLLPVVTLAVAEDRVRGLGDFLVESHDWLRTELADVRGQIDAIIAETDKGELRRSVPDLARQMRTHCLEFCGALKEHHTGEDRGAFPMLAYKYPELEAELTRLGDEHKVVATLQEKIERLIHGYEPGKSDAIRLRDELDQLSRELEAHFAYEERTVVDALNALGPAPNIS